MKKLLCIFLCFGLLISLLPAASAAYDNGYDGTMAGDGAGIYAHGVDISEWQGDEVDFTKIKEQGYSFVILRAGFATTIDDCFEGNYAKAKEAGLDVGVYLYSYADNTEEARQEAEALLNWLSGKQLEYPVYYDLEDPKCHGNMSVEQLTEIAFTFLDLLSAKGWLVGFYSCKSWLETKFDTAAIGANYECWMAQFVSSGTYDIYDRYDDVYGMWQYSCTGTVDGVPGGVDMNVCFKDYPGICRLYGFNGYIASDESLLLRDADIPALLVEGDRLEVSGKILSTRGELQNVTAGIYSLDGQLLTGRSIGPDSNSYNLSDLSYGIRADELKEGTYLFRINASNSHESLTLLNQTLVVSKSGVFLQNLLLPEDLKAGQRIEFGGTVLCASEIRSLTMLVFDESGTETLRLHAEPDAYDYDLSQLLSSYSSLPMGRYRIQLEILTDNALYRPLDEDFSVWAANDPLRLELFTLQSESLPGEIIGLNGQIISYSSDIRQVDIEISDHQGALITRVVAQPRTDRVSLADYNSRLKLEELPIGVYNIRISALNDGGPAVLHEQRFLIREDGLGLCSPDFPKTIYLKDGAEIGGVVFSEVSMLRYVGVSVTDAQGREVLSAASVPNREIFDLSELNDSLSFSSLSCGTYTLRLIAENENGGAILYHASFYVVDHLDVITWSEECIDPRDMAYSAASGYYLTGVLHSAESPIVSATAEILLPDGTTAVSAELTGFGQDLSLEKCNELLRFSALPDGDYILRITASNSTGTYEMLRSPFAVVNCGHRNTRSGQVIQAGCSSCGAVLDSRCLDCGRKVRSGFTMEPLGHQETEGSCPRCGKAGFVSVHVVPHSGVTSPNDRYVLACTDGTSWYALAWDGTTVKIPVSDDTDDMTLNAGLLWRIETRGDSCVLRNPFGKLLHLDSTGVFVGNGSENALLHLQQTEGGFSLCLQDNEKRCLIFDGFNFCTGSDHVSFVLFRYVPDK